MCYLQTCWMIMKSSGRGWDSRPLIDFKILTSKPTGKRPLGRPKRRWEENIRMDLEEMGINAGNWVDSTQGRVYWRALVNACYIQPLGSINHGSNYFYMMLQTAWSQSWNIHETKWLIIKKNNSLREKLSPGPGFEPKSPVLRAGPLTNSVTQTNHWEKLEFFSY